MNQTENSLLKPNGALLIIGGAEDKGDNPETEQEHITENTSRITVLTCFMELVNTENAIIELITSASSDQPEKSFEKYKVIFEKLGAKTVNHIHHDGREQVDTDNLQERLKAANGIFFSGGDQLKLTSLYGGTNFLLLLKQRYISDKIVIAGTSAGAMAMSTPMIYQGVGRDEMIAGNVKVTTGLEFLRDVCIDTHFVNRGRFVRMAQVIATNPTCIGIGIEENTAIIVKEGKHIEVVGDGVIIVVNGFKSFGSNVAHSEQSELLTIKGLQVDVLSKGETFEKPEINPPHL